MTDGNRKHPTNLLGKAFKAQVREYRQKRHPRVLALEYFVAGVPPFQLFELNVEELGQILERGEPEKKGIDHLAELCFIGLAAYFEAFFKDLFAAIVNICPELLERFVLHRDCTFTLAEVLHLADGATHRIGSVLSEHYDWGSAQAVNSLFLELLKVTPFSKEEARWYAGFLTDRNLFVHHGGVYTFRYSGQKFSGNKLKTLAHWDSLTVDRKDVSSWIEFFLGITKKTTAATHDRLENFVNTNKVKLGRERKRAMEILGL